MLRYYCDSKDGLPSYIYDELRRIQECSFHFEDELTPSELVEDIADILVPYKEIPPERLLDCDILLFEFDNNQIKVCFHFSRSCFVLLSKTKVMFIFPIRIFLMACDMTNIFRIYSINICNREVPG